MKIYVAHASSFDYINELYKPIEKSDLNNKYQFTFPHQLSEEPFDSKTFLTQKADLVLAEVSYPSTGLGIELGWASLLDLPIICLFKTGKIVSNSLKVVCNEFISYQNEAELVNKLEQVLLRII